MPQVIRKSLTNARYLIIFNNVDKNNGLVVFPRKKSVANGRPVGRRADVKTEYVSSAAAH